MPKIFANFWFRPAVGSSLSNLPAFAVIYQHVPLLQFKVMYMYSMLFSHTYIEYTRTERKTL